MRFSGPVGPLHVQECVRAEAQIAAKNFMCGIAGLFLSTQSPRESDVAAVQAMLDAEIHRGPDDQGIVRLPLPGSVGQPWGAVLGSRRLAIIDLSPAGHQPMSNEDGRVWGVYNGEIYNFLELRQELFSRGHQFRSHTDTEVILHGYEEWDIDGLLARLEGMFAFALCDTRLREVPPRFVMARDPFGIKPLYYSINRDRVVFASEVRALVRGGLVEHRLNMQALADFLRLGSVPAPSTSVEHVTSLPGGHYLDMRDGLSTLHHYWDIARCFKRSTPVPSLPEAVETTRDLLHQSVKQQLISDVPIGVFLSGGIDSSAILALAAGVHDLPVTTLAVTFGESKFNESRYSDLMARRIGSNHHEIRLQSTDLAHELPRILGAMDQPTVDGINVYFVSRAAREVGLKVVLSGTGGDELFLGYGHFRLAARWGGAFNLAQRLVQPVGGLVSAGFRSAGRISTWTRAAKIGHIRDASAKSVYLLSRGLFTDSQIQALLGSSARRDEDRSSIEEALSTGGGDSLIDSLNVLEFNHYLQNQILKDVDCMSMAHSIEVRVPLLSRQMAQYVFGLPPSMKLDPAMNKPLLVQALGERLPREIWDRPKMGFVFPLDIWLRKHADELQENVENAALFEKRAVREIWTAFRNGHLHWSRPWATYVSTRFFCEFI